jgi:hypothetical protein
MEINENSLGLLMPEIILYNTLNYVFKKVKDDFLNSSDDKKTILYELFGLDENKNKVNFETFNYFEQSKQVFLKANPIQVNLGYNLQVSDIACVHIILPSESAKPLGIGADENYVGYASGPEENTYKEIYTQIFDANYNLIITSKNTMEVILIYNFLKACFLSLNTHLELSGLRLAKTSGQDIQLQSDLVPPHIFHRSLGVSFMYEFHVNDIFAKKLISEFDITGINLSTK